MSPWLLIFLQLLTARAWGFSADDASYYGMPRLFELDEAARCGGLYCLGSFQLLGEGPLMDDLKNFSSNSFHFNHTRLHRGWCVSERCPAGGGAGGAGGSARLWFESCVHNSTWQQLGLRAQLYDLQYCRNTTNAQDGDISERPIETPDIVFAYTVVGILVLNVIGTIYDIFRNEKNKPVKFLLAWSVRANWKRLTADGPADGPADKPADGPADKPADGPADKPADGPADGPAQRDPRLDVLRPLRGIKAIAMVIILLAHTFFAQHLGYVYNPEFLESSGWQTTASFHGTLFVQMFVTLSSFLLGYRLLLAAETKNIGFRYWPLIFLHRLARIVPVYLFVVGLTATWWERGGGVAGGWGGGGGARALPLWAPLLGAEARRCRRKWWAQVLFLNNLIDTDTICLVQTWFIAVDMQLFLVTSPLALALLRRWRGRAAIALLSALTLGAVIFNGIFAYAYRLKPIIYFIRPEHVAAMMRGVASFRWLYAAPWGSLPAALLGLLAAVLLRRAQDAGATRARPWWLGALYRVSLTLVFALPCSTCALMGVTSRGPLAVLAALDKPVFVILFAIALIGALAQLDGPTAKFFSWSGFRIPSRLSLPVLMLHWNFNLTTVAMRTQASEVGLIATGGCWLCVVLLSYLAALPLALLLELPAQKFVQAFFDLEHDATKDELKPKPHNIQS